MTGTKRIVTRALTVGLVAAAVVVMSQTAARAQGTATANMTVQAQVNARCSISASVVDFGVYDPIVTNAAAPLDYTSPGGSGITIACTRGTTATIGLDNGLNAAQAVGTTRAMAGPAGPPANFLSYELYRDSIGGNRWGTLLADRLVPVAAPSRAARTFPVYGRILQAQDVGVGAYQDTVVATVYF